MANLNFIIKNVKCLSYKIFHKSHTRYSNVWVFGEWFGDKCCDNSMYLANYVAAQDEQLKIYWIANETTDTSRLDKRIIRLKKDSPESKAVLMRCGVSVYNQTFDDFTSDQYNYMDGAIMVHLWHGIPWKKIGHDAYGNGTVFDKIYYKISEYVNTASIYISTSPDFDAISKSAFGAKNSQILHVGYPRNNDFYHKDLIKKAKERIISEMIKLSPNIDYSTCHIVSYLPTFRDKTQKSYSIASLFQYDEFMKQLEENNIILVQKSHFVNMANSKKGETNSHSRILFLNDVNSQDLLCASDELITDYSSVFFDFSILDRPIIHFLYDYDYYKNQDRGLYYRKDEVCAGQIVFEESELLNAIIKNIIDPSLYSERRKMVRNKYLPYENINSCKIIYERIVEELSKKGFAKFDFEL